MKPERRFWSAISNSLATTSVVKETRTGGSGNLTVEKTRYTYGVQAAARKISDASIKSATVESNVTTEVINTPTDEFVRYLNIATNEKKQDGTTYDFSDVQKVWARQPSDTQETTEKSKQSFIQSQVTLVPFGDVSPAARKDILSQLRKGGAYKVNYDAVTTKVIDGQEYYNFIVAVQTKKYVSALQKHFIAIGYGEFAPLNSDNYSEGAKVNAQFLIKKSDNSLAGITFNNLTESYSNYGITKKTDIPTDYITLDDLQKRLEKAQ